ncbi:hypothetical protein COV61_02495 [Candidatus Micrarchaeota archaeon CG11_big_fil_rev_8_21_14_0_20_47_5]|nr:MAG: hypothetical protein AUJ17_02180 [Candidatus Micrarchaeota archaeon CG1_02_47_40]PIN83656.1 MAG: hypothetical protein COV61_02495 [Candidatus Micrarchaeota archaeon CG11_big_fil_rev_8_21_14_0_20_47_5]
MKSFGESEGRVAGAFLLGAVFSFCAFLLILFLFPHVILPYFGANAVETVFSPDSEGRIVSFISSAQKTIDCEMYVFTSSKVADALIEAKERGVRVRVIMEKSAQSDKMESLFEQMQKNGVECRWASGKFSRTHSKFLIVDGERVLVGSINFSESAITTNREAGVFVSGKVVEEFVKIFEEDWEIAI